jgi:hypothetical protein
MTPLSAQTRVAHLANLEQSVLDSERQHADVVVGHDAVHPDRNDCGGVGGCALMRAEVDAERRVIDTLQAIARAKEKR